MSNGYCLELLTWDDGKTHLTLWDVDGKDIDFIISPSGAAYLNEWSDELDDFIAHPINLENELLKLAQSLYSDGD